MYPNRKGKMEEDMNHYVSLALDSSLQASAFELASGEKLSLLRSADQEEIGISFDHEATKHFFVLSKPTTKFSLDITVCSNHFAYVY